MTLETLISLANVNEEQAYALTSILNKERLKENMTIEELQSSIDNYCNSLANRFVQNYKEVLFTNEIYIPFLRHISNIGANKKHSGHRFYEALYTKITDYQHKLEDKNENTL